MIKKLIVVALAVAALCLILSGLSLADEAEKTEVVKKEVKKEVKKVEMPAGQKVFTAAKCQMCHTVYSAAVGEPPAKDEKVKEDGPPDLSKAGVGRTAEQMSLFLQKEGALDEKTHMMKFAGSEEDLATLVDWLLTLKPAEEKVLKVTKVKKVENAEKASEGEAAEKSSGFGHDHGDHDKAESEKADEDSHEGHDHGDHDDDAGAQEEKGE